MDKIKTGMKLLIFVWIYYIVSGNFKYKYIRNPVTRTLKGNEKLFEWAGGVNCTEILMRVSGAEEFELSEFVFDIVGYTEFISIFFWGGRGAGVESVGEGVRAPAHVRGKSTGNDFSLLQCSSLCASFCVWFCVRFPGMFLFFGK